MPPWSGSRPSSFAPRRHHVHCSCPDRPRSRQQRLAAPPPGPGRDDAGRLGRGLRRHRHQPAVHGQRNLPAGHRRGLEPAQPDRRGVGHLLGLDAGGDAEIRGADLARRQPRRRRRPGPHCIGRQRREGPPSAAPRAAAAGRFRRHAVLWRQRHHAGHLSPRRHGRAGNRYALAQALRGADLGVHSYRAVHGPAPGHGRGRPLVRAGHLAVVRHLGGDWRDPHRARAGHPGRTEPASRL